jgi:heme/copper-type cytochrome/quinol oxidase subunit 1
MSAVRRYGVLAAGVLLLVIGVVIVFSQPVSFGWTAYAPLSSVTVSPPWPTPATILGGVVGVGGLALIAGWVGFRLGRRPPRSTARRP